MKHLRSSRIKIASSQTTETAISKSSITLLLKEVLHIEAELFNTSPVFVFEIEVE